MVLGAHGEPLFAHDQAWSPRHRPALERAAELEPQIVVDPARVVLLHDELPALALVGAALRLGLRRAAKVALLLVVLERVAAGSRP